jgi:hypothetical protein
MLYRGLNYSYIECPVKISKILHSLRIEKYSALMAYVPVAKIIKEMKKIMDNDEIPDSEPSCLNCAYIKCGSQLLK